MTFSNEVSANLTNLFTAAEISLESINSIGIDDAKTAQTICAQYWALPEEVRSGANTNWALFINNIQSLLTVKNNLPMESTLPTPTPKTKNLKTKKAAAMAAKAEKSRQAIAASPETPADKPVKAAKGKKAATTAPATETPADKPVKAAKTKKAATTAPATEAPADKPIKAAKTKKAAPVEFKTKDQALSIFSAANRREIKSLPEQVCINLANLYTYTRTRCTVKANAKGVFVRVEDRDSQNVDYYAVQDNTLIPVEIKNWDAAK